MISSRALKELTLVNSISITGLIVVFALLNTLFSPLLAGGASISLGILYIIFFFIPSMRKVKSSVGDLKTSEEAAKKMTSEVNKLYAELGRSYQDLEAVNINPEEPAVLLKIDIKGKVLSSTEKFAKILELHSDELPKNITSWLEDEGMDQDILKNLLIVIGQQKQWSGEVNVSNGEGDFIWLDLYIHPVHSNQSGDEIIVLGRDITALKEAQQRSREITNERVAKKVKEQQYRSVLILEGQEEERKRIAQEMHDGIGQMLTGLKLQLEGITPSTSPHMKKRISDTRDLMKSVIKEVRRVSFNLMPSSLIDFGIVPAMKKISKETSLLTDTEVLFENKTGFINRLEQHVETNIYRIVQEAVNNAIKYAEAQKIVISFEHNTSQLTITVVDDGCGFDSKKLEASGHFGASGHGIFNMKERGAFINASIDVQTEIGQGTKIIIALPLN